LPIASVTYDSDDRISVEGKRPNQEVINELIFLTEIGHLTEIKKQLNDMERDKNIDQSFIQEMKDLARDVQLEKMRMILRNNHE
jgi:hypothetical protein